MPKTKKKLETENKSLKGSTPPDTDELKKELAKSGLDMGGGELESHLEDTLEEKLEERPKTEVPPKRERTAEEYLSSISGPPTLQNLFQYCEMRFGFKEGQASSIADYAATTGGPNAFKNPATLLTKMNEFGNIGNPSLRKVIIDFYLQKASIQPTSEYEEKAGLLPGEAKRLNETKKEAERNFAFDPSSGTIRQAMENERGITIAEA
jgi:hypothetical protein